MTYTFCGEPEHSLATEPMDGELWQLRAKNAGLPQRTIAKLCGTTEVAVSQQLRGKYRAGVPLYVKTLIRVWEMLDPEQRARLIALTEANDDKA